jgi:hypothetical protein
MEHPEQHTEHRHDDAVAQMSTVGHGEMVSHRHTHQHDHAMGAMGFGTSLKKTGTFRSSPKLPTANRLNN